MQLNYLLDYEPRSLNDLKLTPENGTLQVTGGIKLWNHFPGVWLPTTMSGTIVARAYLAPCKPFA